MVELIVRMTALRLFFKSCNLNSINFSSVWPPATVEYRLHPIMHLLLFLSPDWLTFCHVIISYKFTRFFIYFLFLSDEGHRPFYISICISTLPTQHTTFISVIIYIYIYMKFLMKFLMKLV